MSVPKLVVDAEFKKLIPKQTPEEMGSLERSVVAEGCRDKLVVWKGKNIILDGHSRYDICQKHGIPFKVVEKELANRGEAKLWILQNQLARRNLTDFSRILVAAESIKLEAQTRKPSDTGKPDRTPEPGKKGEKEPWETRKEKETRMKIAKLAGISNRTVSRAQFVIEKATPEEKESLTRPDSGLTIGKVYRRIKQDALKSDTPPFPKGKFAVLYADVPWVYEFTETDNRAIDNQYPTIQSEDLKLLPVQDITEKDSVLFFWAPASKIQEATEIMTAWGFKYSSGAVWVKDKIGMGYYFRLQHEHLLLGIRGKPPAPATSNRPPSVIEAPRGRHSEKPEMVYELIERMYPHFEKIELFARPVKPRPGWTYWGNEVPDALKRKVEEKK